MDKCKQCEYYQDCPDYSYVNFYEDYSKNCKFTSKVCLAGYKVSDCDEIYFQDTKQFGL